MGRVPALATSAARGEASCLLGLTMQLSASKKGGGKKKGGGGDKKGGGGGGDKRSSSKVIDTDKREYIYQMYKLGKTVSTGIHFKQKSSIHRLCIGTSTLTFGSLWQARRSSTISTCPSTPAQRLVSWATTVPASRR
jgi:hypothetical protein